MNKNPQKSGTRVSFLAVIILLLVGCTATQPDFVETGANIQKPVSSATVENQTTDRQSPRQEDDTAGQQLAAASQVDKQADGQEALTMTVYKSPTCGCCQKWVEIMEAEGFTVVTEDVADISVVKAEQGVLPNLQSCHTAIIDGYVIEGHVPADAIQKLLTERPDVTGLAVPGMPVGSPGMEVDGYGVEPFTVIAFDATGGTETFASYPE
jgi:hypothetical protein